MRRWYDGSSSDALDHASRIEEPQQVRDPRAANSEGEVRVHAVVASHVELAAYDPADIIAECQEQDELLGLEAGSSLELWLGAFNST